MISLCHISIRVDIDPQPDVYNVKLIEMMIIQGEYQLAIGACMHTKSIHSKNGRCGALEHNCHCKYGASSSASAWLANDDNDVMGKLALLQPL